MHILVEEYNDYEGCFTSVITASEDMEALVKLKEMFEARHKIDLDKSVNIRDNLYPEFLRKNPKPVMDFSGDDHFNQELYRTNMGAWLAKNKQFNLDVKQGFYYHDVSLENLSRISWEIQTKDSVEDLIHNFSNTPSKVDE